MTAALRLVSTAGGVVIGVVAPAATVPVRPVVVAVSVVAAGAPVGPVLVVLPGFLLLLVVAVRAGRGTHRAADGRALQDLLALGPAPDALDDRAGHGADDGALHEAVRAVGVSAVAGLGRHCTEEQERHQAQCDEDSLFRQVE